MKIEIISDGLSVNTKVIDKETGKALGLIQKIEWEVSVDEPWATAKITLAKVPVNLHVHKNHVEITEQEIVVKTDGSLELSAPSITVKR